MSVDSHSRDTKVVKAAFESNSHMAEFSTHLAFPQDDLAMAITQAAIVRKPQLLDGPFLDKLRAAMTIEEWARFASGLGMDMKQWTRLSTMMSAYWSSRKSLEMFASTNQAHSADACMLTFLLVRSSMDFRVDCNPLPYTDMGDRIPLPVCVISSVFMLLADRDHTPGRLQEVMPLLLSRSACVTSVASRDNRVELCFTLYLGDAEMPSKIGEWYKLQPVDAQRNMLWYQVEQPATDSHGARVKVIVWLHRLAICANFSNTIVLWKVMHEVCDPSRIVTVK